MAIPESEPKLIDFFCIKKHIGMAIPEPEPEPKFNNFLIRKRAKKLIGMVIPEPEPKLNYLFI